VTGPFRAKSVARICSSVSAGGLGAGGFLLYLAHLFGGVGPELAGLVPFGLGGAPVSCDGNRRIALGITECHTLLIPYERRFAGGVRIMHRVGNGFFVRLGLAVGSATLLVVTVVWPDWIEIVFRVDPDRGNGWLEWLVVFVAFGLTLIFSIGARREWRRPTSAAEVGDGVS
jgi:hypothetical protein